MDLTSLESHLRQHVEVLAQAPRTPGSRGHRSAGEYVAGQLEAAGYLVQETTDHEGGFTCTNFLTGPLPDDPDLPLFIIGAHYDSVPGSPGADDNASAVAALLELARIVDPLLRGPGPFKARLQLAAFDLEEFGYIGSTLHCQALDRAGTNVLGMISLEMLGYIDQRPGSQNLPAELTGLYPDIGNFIGVVGNEASRALVHLVSESLKGIEGLPVESLAVPENGEALPPVRLSDHSSFWDAGHQALMITDTSFFRNPHYHQPTDTPETLDYGFMAKITAGVAEAVRKLVQGSFTAPRG